MVCGGLCEPALLFSLAPYHLTAIRVPAARFCASAVASVAQEYDFLLVRKVLTLVGTHACHQGGTNVSLQFAVIFIKLDDTFVKLDGIFAQYVGKFTRYTGSSTTLTL